VNLIAGAHHAVVYKAAPGRNAGQPLTTWQPSPLSLARPHERAAKPKAKRGPPDAAKRSSLGMNKRRIRQCL
jgi:hypothetical protein